jgi:hypothetical protein
VREGRSWRGLRAGAVACLVAIAANGCSFLFADGPPPNHRQVRYFDCDSSYIYPAIDTVLAAGGLGNLASVAFSRSAPAPAPVGGPAPSSPGPSVSTVLLAIALAAVPVTSAVYGNTKARRCRDAKAELGYRLNASPLSGP